MSAGYSIKKEGSKWVLYKCKIVTKHSSREYGGTWHNEFVKVSTHKTYKEAYSAMQKMFD